MHRKTRLSNIVQETGAKTIHYLYDFGDSRDQVIKLEKWFDTATIKGLPSCSRGCARLCRIPRCQRRPYSSGT
ncbi:IS1096 element passenger TnpR family protein [Bradyrhizobium shewense]|uniref:IS1096 element passenger TnpR family protein n=1 Tax=Bradyrhizobium shewense TaxID=1761772 RepID=UPI0024BF44AD|nr:hypothetical protein [Bradyrhizobium shewense]